MTIESICNQALDRIGYKRHIGTIWEGSEVSKVALNAWSATRDSLFTMLQPDWSRWDDPLTPNKTAPPYYHELRIWDPETDPDLPWVYEYALPELCLVPLTIKPRPQYMPIWRPRTMRWRIKTAKGVYTLLGNDPAPVLTCIHSVHDVTVWHDDFVEAMVQTLTKKLTPLVGLPPKDKGDADNAR